MAYTAVMMDICDSTKMPSGKRRVVQDYIARCLESLNKLYNEDLAKPADFSGGDAVQGLFQSAEAAYLYARAYLLLLYPVSVRCGLGVGTWEIRNEGSTNAQDGTAYHEARRAIEIAHEDPRRSMAICSERNDEIDLNALLLAAPRLKERLTERQAFFQLLLELIAPLAAGTAQKDFSPLRELLSSGERERLDARFFGANRQYFQQDVFASDIFRSRCEPIAIENAMGNGVNYIHTKKKGYATLLAEATRGTRQNVENALHSGEAFSIRDIEAAIAWTLHKRFGG